MQPEDISNRLKKIENELSQIKIILLVVSPLVLFGLFGPNRWISRLGTAIFGLAVLFSIVYIVLTVLEIPMKNKQATREEQLERELLREAEQKSKQ